MRYRKCPVKAPLGHLSWKTASWNSTLGSGKGIVNGNLIVWKYQREKVDKFVWERERIARRTRKRCIDMSKDCLLHCNTLPVRVAKLLGWLLRAVMRDIIVENGLWVNSSRRPREAMSCRCRRNWNLVQSFEESGHCSSTSAPAAWTDMKIWTVLKSRIRGHMLLRYHLLSGIFAVKGIVEDVGDLLPLTSNFSPHAYQRIHMIASSPVDLWYRSNRNSGERGQRDHAMSRPRIERWPGCSLLSECWLT